MQEFRRQSTFSHILILISEVWHGRGRAFSFPFAFQTAGDDRSRRRRVDGVSKKKKKKIQILKNSSFGRAFWYQSVSPETSDSDESLGVVRSE